MQFLRNYMERHQHPGNQLFHLVGLPVTFALPVVWLIQQRPWWWALGAFVVGYVLQFAGHAIEGNDAGEMILVKKMLGRPYLAVVPRREKSRGVADSAGSSPESGDESPR
ncbi:MAG: DUF962 domain-containing protein [Planctomycetales bacterium]|nr:DUF962 domain-containing protein [Planctomycetales bacterium]